MDPGMRTGVIDYSADDSSGPQLALYGRADHSPQQTLTLLDKQRMILRYFYAIILSIKECVKRLAWSFR